MGCSSDTGPYLVLGGVNQCILHRFYTRILMIHSLQTAAACHHQCTAATQLVTKLGFMTFQFSLQKKRSENQLKQGKMSFSFSAEILSFLQD